MYIVGNEVKEKGEKKKRQGTTHTGGVKVRWKGNEERSYKEGRGKEGGETERRKEEEGESWR